MTAPPQTHLAANDCCPLLDLQPGILELIATFVDGKTSMRLACTALRDAVNMITTSITYTNLDIPLIMPVELFSMCPGIKRVDVSRTNLKDVRPLAACVGLQTLDCSATYVTDLAPLAACTGLQTLYCTVTGVRDLTPLMACASLQHVFCPEEISKAAKEALMFAVPSCDVIQTS